MEEIVKILKEAEIKLQELIVAAARTGNYKTIDTARSYAVKLHEMQNVLADTEIPPKTEAESEQRTQLTSAPAQHLTSDKRRKGKQSQYPQYSIEHNSLTRLGWSKKEKREYNHKASRSVYDQTVAAMEKLSKASAGPFMAEQIIEKINENAQAIPVYQIYVVIGFLKHRGVIRQKGREGYNIPIDIRIQSQSLWK
ncbi:MAG: hypothetical protein LLF76_06825 [Planctomycetaceae bacterium]|nr:hypothetical protein [Planctomycetaceae bacterium]